MINEVLSPLDGRYKEKVADLAAAVGPRALAAARVRAEIAWLQVLVDLKLTGCKPFSVREKKILADLPHITEEDFAVLQALEKTGYKGRAATRHDVKAVEYFIAGKLGAARAPWVHFGLTSEDINSAAYGQLLARGVGEVLEPAAAKLRQVFALLARRYATDGMLARTHGQPAVPTTFGREMKVFERRLARQLQLLKKQEISCKFGGAIGAYNAHTAAFAKVNWPRAARAWLRALQRGLNMALILTPVSTQVDPRDTYAELFDNLRRINTILLDFSQDMWQYIAWGVVKQKAVNGEVGSSTMPQKVNPIDFENAEGNLTVANALLTLFSQKLPVSRLQRDLSDSTVLRNIPVALGHCLVAWRSLLTGLEKIDFDRATAQKQLAAHPEVLAEAYQTILRAAGVPDAYEQVKDFTRGRTVDADTWKQFIGHLQVRPKLKEKLLAVSVENYIGRAAEQAGGKYD